MINENKQLTKHFSLAEFIVSENAERAGIDNSPSLQVIKNITRLCNTILEPARMACGPIIISSGYRCPKLNKLIGGSENSAHIEGWAADCTPLAISKLEFAKWIYINCEFDQIILEFGVKGNPAWVHVSADPKNRKEVWQILNNKKGYERVIL